MFLTLTHGILTPEKVGLNTLVNYICPWAQRYKTFYQFSVLPSFSIIKQYYCNSKSWNVHPSGIVLMALI
jgi:hypothetical protein